MAAVAGHDKLEQMSSSTNLAFLKGFLARPWKVASPVPSGRKLARRIAAQIPAEAGGLLLELGPGTGAVTRAIRERGVAEADLVLIESDAEFVALLRSTFPRACIIRGDAFAFARLVDSRDLRSIISGLPVIRLPYEQKRHFVRSAMEALAPGMPLVQFSYSRRPPLPLIDGVTVERAATVWENIWPMRIWVYRASGTKLRNVTE
jgi:phosphatidylethanolamine/phosphatidyl-N-methylethanolamine N-methyltransferase